MGTEIDSCISSPPYGDTIERGDGPGARWDAVTHPNNPDKISSAASYGTSAGQVGRLDAAVSSPPFEASLSMDNVTAGRKERAKLLGLSVDMVSPIDMESIGLRNQNYGFTPGNIGNDTGDTFWSASRAIVEQVYTALKPGGYVAWVTGDFVRKGQRVQFGEQWLALCQACGFEPHTWITAWKTEHHGTQLGFFEDVERRTDRVSFFRRLANERNPDAAILNEDVIIVRRPVDD